MSCFCERFVFCNGYVRKEKRYGPSCPKVGGLASPPAQPLVNLLGRANLLWLNCSFPCLSVTNEVVHHGKHSHLDHRGTTAHHDCCPVHQVPVALWELVIPDACSYDGDRCCTEWSLQKRGTERKVGVVKVKIELRWEGGGEWGRGWYLSGIFV